MHCGGERERERDRSSLRRPTRLVKPEHRAELLEAALELRDLDEPGAIEVDRREDVVAELLELGVVREVLVHFRRGARRLDEPHPAVEQHFDIVPHGARPNA